MSSCLGAQHALRRVAGVETDLANLAHRLTLLATELGVDLDQLDIADRVHQRHGYVASWEEAEAVGLHDNDGAS